MTYFIILNSEITAEMFENSEQTQGKERHTLHGVDRAIFSTVGTPAGCFDGYTQYTYEQIKTAIQEDEWNYYLSIITDITLVDNSIKISGDKTNLLSLLRSRKIKNSTGKDGVYTIVSKEYISGENKTKIVLTEIIPNEIVDGNFLY